MGTPPAPAFLLDQKWPFRIAVASWLLIGVGAWFAAGALDRPAQVIFGGLWFVGLGLLLRQFILSLFGPVLAFDVLRVGRRRRQFYIRIAYALFLAILFTWIYFVWLQLTPTVGGRAPRQRMAQMAEMYFYTYMIVQFIIVCLLTPASVAGAIADEKERRTLEFILATDLSDREILFGKLASRIGSLLLLLAAGLPILGMLQFFGGIDPDLVLAGFAATVIVVLSLAAVGIAASVLSRKARDAIALTYLVGVTYIVLSIVVFAVSKIPALGWNVDIFGYTITFEDVTYPVVCGNPPFMVAYVFHERATAGLDVFTALGHFALFHAIAIAIFVTWAGLRLRSIALRQTFGSQRRPFFRRARWTPEANAPAKPEKPRRVRAVADVLRPAIGDWPVIWKEVFVDTGLKLAGIGRLIVIGLVAMSFVPVAFIFWFTIVDPGARYGGQHWWSADRWNDFGRGMNAYLRVSGTVVSTLVFLAIAIRGAGAVSGERDRHTLDALLTTPMSARAIIWGKWWGCILGMRWAWAWLFGIWMLALAVGGVHPVMLPAAAISIAVYASAFAWIGIYCSLHARTTLRATMFAILASVFLGGGYFLVLMFCCGLPLELARVRPGDVRFVIQFLMGFSPPVNIFWLPIREFDERELFVGPGPREIPYVPFWVIGLVAWAGLSLLLSVQCVHKFRRIANRIPVPDEHLRLHKRTPPLPASRPGRG
jgi:ABC-type transport system involved in multi-copper enzyme maturation permease subunit